MRDFSQADVALFREIERLDVSDGIVVIKLKFVISRFGGAIMLHNGCVVIEVLYRPRRGELIHLHSDFKQFSQ